MQNNILFLTNSEIKLRKKRLISEYRHFIAILNHFVLVGKVSPKDALIYKKREAKIYRMQINEIKIIEELFHVFDSIPVVSIDSTENVETIRQFQESPAEVKSLVLEKLAA